MNSFSARLSSLHEAKIAICYMLWKLDRTVTGEQLYEIILDSGVINYFDYTEALEELIKNGSLSEKDGVIALEEKGRLGADYFKENVPYHFRMRILRAAFSFFSKLERKDEADVAIREVPNGCEVECVIKDASYELMRVSLYAPDKEQAELIKEKIGLNPAGFYSSVISAALSNEEEKIDIEE